MRIPKTILGNARGNPPTSSVLTSFVNGKFVPIETSSSLSSSQATELWDASTGRARNIRVQTATTSELEDAVRSSKAAQQRWNKEYTSMERAHLLREAARLVLEECKDEITQLETLDTGRPIHETQHDAQSVSDCLEWFASVSSTGWGNTAHHQLTTSDGRSDGSFGYTKREPLGVCCGIGAWNFPILSAIWKSAPALAFGNSLIFKPSEYTPSTALLLAEVFQRAGLPDGLFQVLLGDGPTIGSGLVRHPTVSKISFTGSVATGKLIYQTAAAVPEQLKKVTLELGGKSPLIVFDDVASIDAAVTATMMANWYSSGQVCSNGTRVYVQESIHDAFVQRLIERTSRLKIGHPMDPNTHIGPMVSKPQMEKVLEYIRIGEHEDGATLVYGDRERYVPPTHHEDQNTSLREGYFLTPAIFTDCRDDMKIVQEEIFGMVCSVLRFSTEQEVLERANGCEMGLAAGVFTKDIQRAHRMVHSLEAGTTWINNYNLAPVELPWGGWKNSGIGSENGLAAMESWTRTKSVYVELNDYETLESPYDTTIS